MALTLWHGVGVRFFPLLVIFLALALGGCMTPLQKAARQQQKAERQQSLETTRGIEQRRLLAVENGEVNSRRGADIYIPDKNRAFDPNRATSAAAHSYSTGQATTKSFYSDRQVRLDTYQTRDFYDAKPDAAGHRKFTTNEANTHGNYLFTDATKTAATKTAPTKESPYAHKDAPTKYLADGHRQFLGPENKKLHQATDAKELANWRNANEGVTYSDGTVERISSMKQLSIGDIRELLNKSK